MSSQPVLHNIRILDFTRVLAGPYATRVLADFGAKVIKIQSPNTPAAEDDFARGYYNTWNRNKLSITLNLDKPEGIALAKRLVSISDAVAENFTPRVMASWGLDYENLKKIKPDIIMLSMSVMGSTGPQRNYVGFGPTVQALSGITHLTSFPDKPPMGIGFSYADHIAGLFGALALLDALEQRHRTGEGKFIDLSEVEAMSSLLGDAVLDYTANGNEVKPVGNSSSQAAPHNVYPCRGDGRWCAIAVFTNGEWQGFKRALGNSAWADDAKFSTLSGRLSNAAVLDKMIAEWTMTHTAEEVVALLQRHGVAAGAVQDARDLSGDPQLRARGFFVELGETVSDALPVRLSRSQASYKKAALAPDQDNSYVFGQLLGMTELEIAALRKNGIV